ncbi:MAG: SUMF1/EgtB/PvdO family nonheme iron enzyme [Bacilli bacterium]|nr:SUMF1/EgtB/PvdO family nonheme iron enzyme [Bacilli bacterium]
MDNSTYPVKTKYPNALQIYDMCDNVSEWCFDINPKGTRIHRGGSYASTYSHVSIDTIKNASPSSVFGNLGFRLARHRGYSIIP